MAGLEKILELAKTKPEILDELIKYLDSAEDNINLADALCILLDNLVEQDHIDNKIAEIIKGIIKTAV